MTTCIFEDEKFTQFLPLTYLRPVAALQCGIGPLYQRARRYFPENRVALAVRDAVVAVTAHVHSEIPVNIIKRDEHEDVLFINGRIRSWGDLPTLVKEARISTRFVNRDMETVAVLFKPPIVNHTSKVTMPSEYLEVYRREMRDIPDSHTSSTLFGRLWEIVADVDSEIRHDFETLQRSGSRGTVHQGAYLLNPEQILVGEGADVMPGAVIDARSGPVMIGDRTRVQAHASIYGPSSIGSDCVVAAGVFSGVSIGHTCRIGGEIEESVFQPYVNKHHAGFIGHSYVGSWVNFGAMTTNSDLKNNYSTIRVSDGSTSLIDTGSNKVGSFIGDHTKFGIGTLLNTGIIIGVCCNVFGGSLVADKEVPNFRWGKSGSWEPHRLETALETAKKTMERRKQVLSGPECDALRMARDGKAPADGCLHFA